MRETMRLPTLACYIAIGAHAGQTRRDGRTPYSKHAFRVSDKMWPDEDAVAVAWLHDVIEDTEETEYTLKAQGVPDHVVNAVVDMTKVEGESYADYMVRVAANPLARKVKIADMLDNLSDDPTPKQIKKYARGLLVLVVE